MLSYPHGLYNPSSYQSTLLLWYNATFVTDTAKYNSKILITRSEMRNGIYPRGEFPFNRLQWAPGQTFIRFRAALQAVRYYLQLTPAYKGLHHIEQLDKYDIQMYSNWLPMTNCTHTKQIVCYITWCIPPIMRSACAFSWFVLAEYQSISPLFRRSILLAVKDSSPSNFSYHD